MNRDDGLCPVCRKAPVIDEFFGECRECLGRELGSSPAHQARIDRRRNGRPLSARQRPFDDENDG